MNIFQEAGCPKFNSRKAMSNVQVNSGVNLPKVHMEQKELATTKYPSKSLEPSANSKK